MRKTLFVAIREFQATVLTKGFLIGVFMTPLMLGVVIFAVSMLKNLPGPRVSGTVAVIDRSGLAADAIKQRFSPDAVAKELADERRQAEEAVDKAADKVGLDQATAAKAKETATQPLNGAPAAAFDVEILPPTTDPDAAKAPLATANARGDTNAAPDPKAPKPRLVVAVIPPDAVQPAAGRPYAGFQLFTAPRLDFEVLDRLQQRIASAIVDARISSNHDLSAAGISADQVRAMVKRPDAQSLTVTTQGERKNAGGLAFVIPAAFMLLMLMSVMVGGQGLLNSTIEEKSTRVIEILLSAVSPIELMTGKIVGQMVASLIILVVYSGLGLASLIVFSLMHLLDPMSLVYLAIFFVLAFSLMASLMAAVGSAVNDPREAQALMTPVMLLVILPWLLWMPISRAPNSAFSTIMSFVPGLNPFVMIIRLTGSEPVPTWQIPVGIAVGILSSIAGAWAAAKIFRIGVLMYGKPPNFATMIRWIRMA